MTGLGSLLPCVHPLGQLACLTVLAIGFVSALVFVARRRRPRWEHVAVYLAVLAMATWLGSLRYSPLAYGSPRWPLLSGFDIRRPNRAPIEVAAGGIVTASAGAPMVIHPRLLPDPVDCLWSAPSGGALDDSHSCDTIYAAPAGIPFEVLRLRVRSACGLAPAAAQIKMSILP